MAAHQSALQTLGLQENANKEEIEKAYKCLGRMYYPTTKAGLKNANKFEEISNAFRTLIKFAGNLYQRGFDGDYEDYVSDTENNAEMYFYFLQREVVKQSFLNLFYSDDGVENYADSHSPRRPLVVPNMYADDKDFEMYEYLRKIKQIASDEEFELSPEKILSRYKTYGAWKTAAQNERIIRKKEKRQRQNVIREQQIQKIRDRIRKVNQINSEIDKQSGENTQNNANATESKNSGEIQSQISTKFGGKKKQNLNYLQACTSSQTVRNEDSQGQETSKCDSQRQKASKSDKSAHKSYVNQWVKLSDFGATASSESEDVNLIPRNEAEEAAMLEKAIALSIKEEKKLQSSLLKHFEEKKKQQRKAAQAKLPIQGDVTGDSPTSMLSSQQSVSPKNCAGNRDKDFGEVKAESDETKSVEWEKYGVRPKSSNDYYNQPLSQNTTNKNSVGKDSESRNFSPVEDVKLKQSTSSADKTNTSDSEKVFTKSLSITKSPEIFRDLPPTPRNSESRETERSLNVNEQLHAEIMSREPNFPYNSASGQVNMTVPPNQQLNAQLPPTPLFTGSGDATVQPILPKNNSQIKPFFGTPENPIYPVSNPLLNNPLMAPYWNSIIYPNTQYVLPRPSFPNSFSNPANPFCLPAQEELKSEKPVLNAGDGFARRQPGLNDKWIGGTEKLPFTTSIGNMESRYETEEINKQESVDQNRASDSKLRSSFPFKNRGCLRKNYSSLFQTRELFGTKNEKDGASDYYEAEDRKECN